MNIIKTFIYGETDRDRCDAWLTFIKDRNEFVELYLAAGKLPFSRELPLKIKMRAYIQNKVRSLRLPLNIHTLEGNAWGTFEETILLLEYLKKEKEAIIHSKFSWYETM